MSQKNRQKVAKNAKLAKSRQNGKKRQSGPRRRRLAQGPKGPELVIFNINAKLINNGSINLISLVTILLINYALQHHSVAFHVCEASVYCFILE